jgi:hypothetical protein
METQRHSNLELTNGGYIPYQAGLSRHTYLSLGIGSYKAWTGRQETGTFGGGSREFRSRSKKRISNSIPRDHRRHEMERLGRCQRESSWTPRIFEIRPAF